MPNNKRELDNYVHYRLFPLSQKEIKEVSQQVTLACCKHNNKLV